MTHFRFFAITVATVSVAGFGSLSAEEGLSSYQAIVSVADQKIAVVRDGAVVAKYPISTSRFGVGDSSGSYKTPLGKMKVCEKLGDNLPSGAVIKHRRATGEVLTVNAPGRDPIVTRILWLDGQESGNANAKDRSIYIHGTPEERLIGRPASYGCIRMRSQDVIALYKELGVGSTVSVISDKLPRLAKYEAPKPTPVPKPEVAKITPPEKPAPVASPKVLAAMAEAREHEEKQERLARQEEKEKSERELKLAREAQEEREQKAERDARAAAAVRLAQVEAPAPRVLAKTPKPEKASAPTVAAKAEKPALQPPTPPPAIAAAPGSTPLPYSAPRLALARERLSKPRPVVLTPPPVDPDRLQFLKDREASLALTTDHPTPSMNLSERLKGSILESNLPPSEARVH